MRALILMLVAAVGLPVGPALAAEEPLAVIVPHNFNGRPPSMQELALIFKRKKLAWDDGTPIQPVNLPPDHAARRQFSLHILKSLPEAQTQYWNVMYFHGVFPPHVVASSEAMLRFVAETGGGIGYLAACKLDSRVKAILWIDASGSVSENPPPYTCSKE